MGVKPVIFEKQEKPGGFLRSGILNYRLPKDILDEDIRYIEGMGVEIRTGTAIGQDVSFDELVDEYDAVLIAVGLSLSRGLPIPGADLPQVLLAVPFLAAVNAGEDVPEIGRETIVIGGGNVAIDVARSAKRLSEANVTMVCLEADYEMPAHSWEIEDARAEGINIVCSQGPHRIVGEGKVEGLEVKKCEAVFDEQGRFAPRFCETELTNIPGDSVIIAIGQMSDMSFLTQTGPALNDRGILIFDREKATTTRNGVFASGEVVTGPGAAVNALASGRRAAISMARYLGLPVSFAHDQAPVEELPTDVAEKVKKSSRRQMPALPAEERIKSFVEVETGLGDVDGRCEASRCLLCANGARYSQLKCIACLTCVRVCPYNAPYEDKDGLVALDPLRCQACGICFTQCPAKAIDLELMPEAEILERIDSALAEGSSRLEFGCWYPQSRVEPDWAAVMLPCTGRLSTRLLLHAFEAGAEKVVVAVCSEDDDGHFVHGHRQTRAAVEEARELLAEAGLDPEALEIRLVPEKKCVKA
jgi:thioredoxin reductase/Pyruvate/2-oxoacid:ferredoxin oxidoreductase delta subunit